MRVYLQNAGAMVALAATAVIPVQLLALVLIVLTVSNANDVPTSYVVGNSAGANVGLAGQVFVFVLSLFATALATAAIVRAASAAYRAEPVDADESLRFAVKRLAPILSLAVLMSVLIALAFLALVVPGIYFFTAWSVATPALVLEGLRPVAALRRSRALVRGRWWRVYWTLVVTGLLVGVVGLMVSAALFAITGTGSSVTAAASIRALVTTVAEVMVLPFGAAIATVLYHQLLGDPTSTATPTCAIEPAVAADGAHDAFGRTGEPPPPGWSGD